MVINQDKVITIPRSTKASTFLCPCAVCLSRLEEESYYERSLDTIKESVEQMLQSTQLSQKELDISIFYTSPNQRNNLGTSPDVTPTSELKPAQTLYKSAIKFVTDFNKKYRHPLMCKLTDEIYSFETTLIVYAQIATGRPPSPELFAELENSIVHMQSISEILKEIRSSSFIDEQTIDRLQTKTMHAQSATKKTLRQQFIDALNSPEFVTTEPVQTMYTESIYS